MTPLEELQAAHAQLSDLRERAAHGPRGHLNIEDVDLIVTLHRTIDAQLSILQEGIYDVQGAGGLSTDWWVHQLARAINGTP